MLRSITAVLRQPRQKALNQPTRLARAISRLCQDNLGFIFDPIVRTRAQVLFLQDKLPQPRDYSISASDDVSSFQQVLDIFAAIKQPVWKGWLFRFGGENIEHELTLTRAAVTIDGKPIPGERFSDVGTLEFARQDTPDDLRSQKFKLGRNCGALIVQPRARSGEIISRRKDGRYLTKINGAVELTPFTNLVEGLLERDDLLGFEFAHPALTAPITKAEFFNNLTDGSFEVRLEFPQVVPTLHNNFTRLIREQSALV
jgi:hypothetical protein